MASKRTTKTKALQTQGTSFSGFVNGVDVIATPGMAVRCLAFINKHIGDPDYVQVVTEEHRLQTALELACAKGARVSVTYVVNAGMKVLNRVQLLDRP